MSELELLHIHITDTQAQSIPKRIGTYVITHTNDNIYAERYVGSSKNLFNRRRGHYNKEIICIDLYVTDDIEIANSLERILIELINPATNITIPPLSNKDRNFMIKLLESGKIKKDIYNNTVKIGCRYLKLITSKEKIRESNNSIQPKEMNVRKMFKIGNTPVIAIPQDIAFETGSYVSAEKIDENTIKLTKVNVNITPVESKVEKKPKIRVELTRDDLQRIEKDRNQELKLYIEKGFTEEEALIDFSYGFPMMQLIKYQNGK